MISSHNAQFTPSAHATVFFASIRIHRHVHCLSPVRAILSRLTLFQSKIESVLGVRSFNGYLFHRLNALRLHENVKAITSFNAKIVATLLSYVLFITWYLAFTTAVTLPCSMHFQSLLCICRTRKSAFRSQMPPEYVLDEKKHVRTNNATPANASQPENP